MTLAKTYGMLRRKNLPSYLLLSLCLFVSVLLITAFGTVLDSHTVQEFLPEGGDSRKQMVMIFVLAMAGCMAFTGYASSLFFRGKSRETGVLMALGARRRQLSPLLFGDIALVAAISSAAGLALGLPLAAGIWQLFRLFVVDSVDMAFRPSLQGFIWPLIFLLCTLLILFSMGLRFIRRGNIIDIVNEQRKSEPVRDVKKWQGFLGLGLLIGGAGGALVLPSLLADLGGYTTPFWVNLLYIPAAVGLYLMLLFVVVRGFGGQKQYYKHIIARSMMKFQGRQTVQNMCVITVLIIAAYFSLFYLPMNVIPQLLSLQKRDTHFAFHHRVDETGVPGQAEIERLAAEEKVRILQYTEVPFANMATDGIDKEPTGDGRFGNTYLPFYAEESFLSESAYRLISGDNADVKPGQFLFLTAEGYAQRFFDYYEDMKLFTNPSTKSTLEVRFQEERHNDLLNRYIVLDDADYAALTEGLSEEWKETWVQFNVEDPAASYPFAQKLQNAIIDGCTEASAMYENYDRVDKLNINATGQDYRGDVDPELRVSYEDRETSQFNIYWRYIPRFAILEQNTLVRNLSVQLMLFLFMSLICFCAVGVIAYTRCLTIAMNNRQVYTDLRRLGAKRAYLVASVRGQLSKVFAVPIAIGSLGILAFNCLLLLMNDGQMAAGEWTTLGVDLGVLVLGSALLWGIYRFTYKKVRRTLEL